MLARVSGGTFGGLPVGALYTVLVANGSLGGMVSE
jgi:hypothetical protein